MLCHFQNHLQSDRILCLDAALQPIRFQQFWQDVALQRQAIQALAQPQWALWEHDSYRFLVLLFAGLLANKSIILPPHRVRDLEHSLAAEQIFFLEYQPVTASSGHLAASVLALHAADLEDDFLNSAQLFFYTSGSTGTAKQIPRSLKQLLNEVQGLDQSFDLSQTDVVLATVSHQHIYGLLFKLLWPLARGHAFYTPQLAFPEDVVASQKLLAAQGYANAVISSPALLKRWGADVALQHCHAVFSSGGRLESGIRPQLNAPIMEILGSSETGGIAHRQQDEACWTPFANVEVQVHEQQLAVRSNHACDPDWIYTGDCAELVDAQDLKSPFKLKGRMDRIVKLEEKRLSLDAIEQQILSLAEIEQCRVLLTENGHRQILACVVVLHPQAQAQLQQQHKAGFVRQLKSQLNAKLEQIAIPRTWRFLTELPRNSQSKLNHHAMQALFQAMHLPVILSQHQQADSAQFKLEFPPELAAFKGHFPDFPIYPGVGQIGFIQHFAKRIWPDLDWCNGLEQIKFQELIQPYSVLELKLSRRADKVSFQILSMSAAKHTPLQPADPVVHAAHTVASGRLCFVNRGSALAHGDSVQA